MAVSDALIARIHGSPTRIVLSVTGGGSRAIASLLETPGASRTLVEGYVPYAAEALRDFLGSSPEHFCSAETARAMAVTAYLRGIQLLGACPALAGVSCTASLASDRPKKGAHRCHVAAQDRTSTTTYSLTLARERRDRRGEESVVAELIVAAVARASGIGNDTAPDLLDGEQVQSRRTVPPREIIDLFAGKIGAVFVDRTGSVRALVDEILSPAQAVLPGAFNPLHEGHRHLARAAAEILGRTVCFEISLMNVDKPALNYTDLEDRLVQFRGQAGAVVTCAPTFLEKARVLPGSTFVIGYDTAARLVAPRYYGGRPQMVAALGEMRALGTRFLVAGRVEQGRFCTLADVPVPSGHTAMFQAIAESQFRNDLSSTALRRQQG